MGDRKIRKEIKVMLKERKVLSLKELCWKFDVSISKMSCLVGDVMKSGVKFRLEV